MSFLVLVDLVSIVLNLGVFHARGDAGAGQLGNLMGSSVTLLGLVFLVSFVTHGVARHRGFRNSWADAFRILSYATAGYVLLRLPALAVFALKLEHLQGFALVLFVAWSGPVVFALMFATRAVRGRYRTSWFRAFTAAFLAPLAVTTAISVAYLRFFSPGSANGPVGETRVYEPNVP